LKGEKIYTYKKSGFATIRNIPAYKKI